MMGNSIKSILLAVVVALFIPVLAPATADAAKPETSVFVNGAKIKYTQPPITENGTTLVSARETIEGLGLQFSWDKANKRVIGSNGEMTLALTLGAPVGTVNGVSLFLGTPAVERNGRIMVPLRFLLDGLGASMQKKGDTLSITTAAKEKSKFYTGLPLEITNTSVKNLSDQTITVTYEEYKYLYDDKRIYGTTWTIELAPGQKGAFENASAVTGDVLTEEYKKYDYYGRVVKSVTVNDVEQASAGYEYADKMYVGTAFEDSLMAMYDKQIADFKKKMKQELVKNKNIPLKIVSSSVSFNSLNYPDANIRVENLTEKKIISFELSFSCYDAYNDPVNRSFTKSNRFYGVSNNADLAFGESATFVWDLFSYSSTTKISNIKIDKVAFSDGTVWKR
ncbi:hypothetical protein K0T92_08145 [Paenibacillus oenotherae]|uniref:Copper amine oxidase-like N-terminal domain-containing protein n=1 Tax=Paenibacillus oenotherae TaxID=1435645 RepID=A0ABS7D4B9_9BACL|nr:stalk domain-containing protein [Paenibacillus oenotherae]MBW7474714.1 hypothetical protein [Paenibacillus oenotherae]